jgi:hypothetical protein
MRRGRESFRLPSDWDAKNPEHVDLLNRNFVEIQQRLDTIQSIGATAPKAPQTITATGKQGCIWLTWQRVVNADGYIVAAGSESTMSKLVSRNTLPDSESCTYQLPVGNVASQFWFQVFSYRGNQISPPSPTVNATSVAFGAGEAAPPTPPNDPRSPLRAGITGGPNRP